MKLTTKPSKQELTTLAQDILFEIRLGLISAAKFSTENEILVYKVSTDISTGKKDLYMHIWNRATSSQDDRDVLQYGYDNAVEVLVQILESTGGKFTRFQ